MAKAPSDPNAFTNKSLLYSPTLSLHDDAHYKALGPQPLVVVGLWAKNGYWNPDTIYALHEAINMIARHQLGKRPIRDLRKARDLIDYVIDNLTGDGPVSDPVSDPNRGRES